MSVPKQGGGQRQQQGRQRQRQIQPCIALIACCWLAVAQGWTLTGLASGGRRLKLCNHQSRKRCRCTQAAAGAAAMAADGSRKRLVVIGGGAAGYFGAIQAAASSSELDVIVLEAGRLPLQKVKISGGGRCNVMHDSSKAVSLIAKGYPRGSKQLIGPFKSLFGPEDAAAWFRSRGVRLKTEGDGRMFPVTDDSQTVIDCLEGAARKASVEVVTSARVGSIIHRLADPTTETAAAAAAIAIAAAGGAADPLDANSGRQQLQQSQHKPRARFEVKVTTATPLPPAMRRALGAASAGEPAAARAPAESPNRTGGGEAGAQRNRADGTGSKNAGGESTGRGSYVLSCDYILQATGAAREGHGWAKGLGHAVSAPVPSLFTLTIKDPRLEGLSGLSVQDAELKLFAEEKRPEGSAAEGSDSSTSPSRGGVAGGGARHTVRSDGGGGDAAVVAEQEGGGETGVQRGEGTPAAAPASKRTKKKRAKKQPAVTQRGPLLITHTGGTAGSATYVVRRKENAGIVLTVGHPALPDARDRGLAAEGVSGPAALKLSAFGARVLNEGGYRGKLVVNWMAGNNPSKALDDLQAFRTKNPKKTVCSFCPIVGSGADASSAGPAGRSALTSASTTSMPSTSLPRRLWQSLALAAGVAAGDKWGDVSKAKLSALAQQLTACDLQIVGKGSFKEEFVTCGGVALSALDMRTMESKSVPGLFFAGEVVDVDGVTGGFNFQSAWTTGWVAGTAIAAATAAAPAAEVDKICADELPERR